MTRSATVVGGGIGGLVAAIELAEQGWGVELYERSSELGGNASTAPDPYRTNVGPHALYANNPLFGWMERRGLLPPLATPGPADPGRLSAPTVHASMRAAWVEGRVRYVRGGFGTLVEVLAGRARELGVGVHVASPVDALPDPPCILAVDLDAARRLTGDVALRWPGDPLALLDVAITESRRDGAALLDLGERVWANEYSRVDPTITPAGTHLVQAHAGLRDGEDLSEAIGRIESHLDDQLPGWRERERWRQRRLMRVGASPADPPGTTWRDRPAVRRADGVYVVNDRMAQPGLLSSISIAAARGAVADLTGASSRSVGGGTVTTSIV